MHRTVVMGRVWVFLCVQRLAEYIIITFHVHVCGLVRVHGNCVD